MDFEKLTTLSNLIKERNHINKKICSLIRRPALISHIGEFIAKHIFDIELNESASQKGYDGVFLKPPLNGETVNIKFYRKCENVLDINLKHLPKYYLVITGPKHSAISSRDSCRPLLIEYTFLFEASPLIEILKKRRVKIREATSVISKLWDEAEIFPQNRQKLIVLDEDQIRALRLFSEN